MKYKAIIFDFDGLMFDTEKVWQENIIKANKFFNINFTDDDRIYNFGKPEQEVREYIKSKFPGVNPAEYRNWTKANAVNHFNTIGADSKKGLRELLDFIQNNQILTGIASGSDKNFILNILNKANIDESIFKSFATAELNLKSKPNPDAFLKACADLGVKPQETIVLEDSYNGVRAGHNAGCFTIMIPDTMPVTEEMRKTADLIFDDLNEVITFLKNN